MKRPLLSAAALLLAPHAAGAGAILRAEPAAPSASSDTDGMHRRRLLSHDRPQPGPEGVWNDFMRERAPRQDREPVHVDYMGNHPFEDAVANGNDAQNERRAQRVPATTYTSDDRYQPMRVQFDTHLLGALAQAYPSHVSYVEHVLLPSLRNFWAETLSVIPAKQIEVPLSGNNAKCAAEVKRLSGLDLGDFLQVDVSSSARTITNIGSDKNVEFGDNGDSLVYNDKDLVVIVIPVEGTALCPEPTDDAELTSALQTLAFATNCQHDQLDRPTVGYTGICFGPMDPSDRTTKTHKRRLLTIAHEFTHILGMNSYDFPFFYSHVTRKPRTPRNDWNRPPTNQVLCVDGARQSVLTASEDTIKPVTTANGYIGYEVVTETVRNVVRNQFDCPTLEGARLENQPTGETDCFGSHWDHRLFNNEFMTAVYTGSTQYVTALTLALLEDSGWYIPNYSVAQNSPFAKGAGCDFVEDECIQSGYVPSWGQGLFCSSANDIGCTPDKHLVAYCDISQWDGNLPSGYQYFDNPSVGGGLQQMDFCPAYTTVFRFEVDDQVRVLDCTDGELNGAWVQKKGETFGQNSQCIEHASGRHLQFYLESDEATEHANEPIIVPYTEIRETIGQSQAQFVHAWQSSLKAASDDYTHRVRQLWENVFDDIVRLSGRSEQDLRGLPHEEAVRLYVSTLEECRHLETLRDSLAMKEEESELDEDSVLYSIRKKANLSTQDSTAVKRRAEEMAWLHETLASIPSSVVPRLVAHRGFHCPRDNSGKRPLENSLSSFETAWAAGIHFGECDVAVTKDGVLVLAHDEDFSRLALDPSKSSSKKKVSDLTLKEIISITTKSGARPPLLVDVLRSAQAIGGFARLVVEVKPGNQEACEALIKLFRQHPDLIDRCAAVMSFDAYTMHKLSSELKELASSLKIAAGQYHRSDSPDSILVLAGDGSTVETQLKMPEVLLLTVAQEPQEHCELRVGVADFSPVDRWLKHEGKLSLQGVYLQFQLEMLHPAGAAALKALANKYRVGIWGYYPTDPDDVYTARFLVEECGVSFFNTDLPRNFLGKPSAYA
ncbi:hypothetical protein ACHAXT_011644 [Thalassiosira profunda]